MPFAAPRARRLCILCAAVLIVSTRSLQAFMHQLRARYLARASCISTCCSRPATSMRGVCYGCFRLTTCSCRMRGFFATQMSMSALKRARIEDILILLPWPPNLQASRQSLLSGGGLQGVVSDCNNCWCCCFTSPRRRLCCSDHGHPCFHGRDGDTMDSRASRFPKPPFFSTCVPGGMTLLLLVGNVNRREGPGARKVRAVSTSSAA